MLRFGVKKIVLGSVALAGLLVSTVSPLQGAVVINEVYGGGGNAGSTFKNDFIELFNNGLTAVPLTGFVLQYASAAGGFDPADTTTDNQFNTFLTGTIPAGGFFLIQEAQGAGGTTDLPTADVIDTTPLAMSGTAGKVRLVDTADLVVDLVGYGSTATPFEGAGPAPGTTNPTSASRTVPGVDTNNNNLDFTVGPPSPINSAGVPEPTSLGVLAFGSVLLLRRRRA